MSDLDLIWKTFGQWPVIGKYRQREHGKFWLCQCEGCANFGLSSISAELHEDALLEGKTKDCGCSRPSKNKSRRHCLIGQQFGGYLVLDYGEPGRKQCTTYQCRCLCGRVQSFAASMLISKKNLLTYGCHSCSKHKQSGFKVQRWYGNLFVHGRAPSRRQDSHWYWRCKCRCGQKVIVSTSELLRGHSQSRGCRAAVPLQGKRFGKLYVLRNESPAYWLCVCDCGQSCVLPGSAIRSGNNNSCGKCLKKTITPGQRFERLVTIEKMPEKKHGKIIWQCRCDCGQIHLVRASCLQSGHTRSCGCLRQENAQQIGQRMHAKRRQTSALEATS